MTAKKSTTINMIGLEAEFILGKDGKVVYPAKYDFDTDDFIILGEFRALPGNTRGETVGNFLKEYYSMWEKINKKGLTINSLGYEVITPKFYSEILREMGNKEIAQCKNIYDIDLLTLSDSIVEDGVMKGYKISAGLHVHFSSLLKQEVTTEEYVYTPKKVEFNFGEKFPVSLDYYERGELTKTTQSIQVSRITQPVINYFVKEFDDKILPKYKIETPLKFRNPGFYEIKSHGFEYRSLPFNHDTLTGIYSIVDFAFNLLEGL